MRILLAAGGTGGHLFPGIALAHEFKRRNQDAVILFIVTGRGLEQQVLAREGFSFKTLRVEGLLGRGVRQRLRSMILLPLALRDAYAALREFMPDLVIGIGGYMSGPVLMVAGFFNAWRVIVEPNARPGWTNLLLARLRRVDTAIVAHEESRACFEKRVRDVQMLGSPVRRDLVMPCPSGAPSRGVLLVLGGSQGAHSINRAMVESLELFKRLMPDLTVIHQTGPEDFEWVRRAYQSSGIHARVEPFLQDMQQAYQQADLVLSRAGAVTVAEITACGKPAILVPYPRAADQHQLANARILAEAGAACIVEDHQLSADLLTPRVRELMGDRDRLRQMARCSARMGRPRATEEIVDHCLQRVCH